VRPQDFRLHPKASQRHPDNRNIFHPKYEDVPFFDLNMSKTEWDLGASILLWSEQMALLVFFGRLVVGVTEPQGEFRYAKGPDRLLLPPLPLLLP
jgi:hypothetical protein